MSAGKVIAVILVVAALVFFVGNWLAAGVESGWS